MKKLIITCFILIIIFIYFVPDYNELNNLAIIDSIGIEKKENEITYYLREVYASKSNNNIKYEYKIYSGKSISEIAKSTKKKLYLHKVKSLITNTDSNKYIKKLNINPKNVYLTNNVEEKING